MADAERVALFHVQDGDRPMYVIASDWGCALAKWRAQIINENPDCFDAGEQPQPDGIQLLAVNDGPMPEVLP